MIISFEKIIQFDFEMKIKNINYSMIYISNSMMWKKNERKVILYVQKGNIRTRFYIKHHGLECRVPTLNCIELSIPFRLTHLS